MSVSKLQFAKEVNPQLRKFADGLKANEDYYDKGIQLCERVCKFLAQEISGDRSVGFSIAATYYGGSIGKKTDVEKPDFDIVMKINNRLPPFTELLNYFENLLRRNAAQLEISAVTFRLTRFSIQFAFINGMQVDLLPASADLTEDQVYEKMKMEPKNRRYYSSSLVEAQVAFMSQQTAFTHAVVRLAKYWYKSMDLGHAYVSGGSTIFELLAVAAVLEGGPGEESVLEAFTQVVDNIAKLDQLKLAFEKSYAGWKIKGSSTYGQQVPYLMEPSNEYNNLLHGMKASVLENFKKNGKTMQQRLNNLMQMRQGTYGTVVIDFDKLFPSV